MAVGFTGDDGYNDTIQATIDNGIDYARSQLRSGESRVTCLDCDSLIPIKRREVVRGCLYCVNCQSIHDNKLSSGYNRRGSKDSQLR